MNTTVVLGPGPFQRRWQLRNKRRQCVCTRRAVRPSILLFSRHSLSLSRSSVPWSPASHSRESLAAPSSVVLRTGT